MVLVNIHETSKGHFSKEHTTSKHGKTMFDISTP